MRTSLSLPLVCFLFLGAVGCTTTMQGEFPVSDENALLDSERKKNQVVGSDSATKLKDMSAANHLGQGNSALGRNDLVLATLHFTLALSRDENLIAAYHGLAESLRREGKFDAAMIILEKALIKEQNCIPAMAKLGALYRTKGEYEKSLDILLRASEVAPDNPWVMTELAITYEMSGQATEAEGYFKNVVKLLPDSSVAFSNLGFNQLLLEKHQDAIPELERALNLAPKNRIAMNNLALAYVLNDDAVKALQLFEASVGKAGAYNNLGYLLMVQNHIQAAELALTRAQEMDPFYYPRANENLERLEAIR